jgi:Ca2+/Na+ antiporter
MIAILIPIVLVAVIILIVASLKNQDSEGSESMMKSVYLYLVLFATLMMTIGGSVGVFMALADIVAPAPYYQTYEEYVRNEQYKPNAQEDKVKDDRTEEELRADYESMVRGEEERQMRRAKNSLIKSFGWIVIPLPVFILFQRKLVNR